MSHRTFFPAAIFSVILFLGGTSQAQYQPSNAKPPEPHRELRAAWVASVHNIDWPSRPGLSPSQQRAELVKLLDIAASTGINAIILQVRPEGDALYKSSIEPWSYWLTGAMGKAPSDGYDPLAFAIHESHKRGIELHAWFNPFRARASTRNAASSRHISKTNPSWMLPSGSQVWANPGIRAVQDRAIQVMTDVTKRYDVDAIHIDDYFYPYPKKVNGKMIQQFDDSATYAAYRQAGGTLKVTDWRRAEMDGFIHRLYDSIKATKRWVKFGISPFGIWRPGHPRSIEADLDSYEHIAADSRKWLQNGWLDYFSPQLYWRIDDKPHSFTTLVDWWADQNKQQRHLWPGIASSRIQSADGRRASESIRQIEAARKYASTKAGTGHVHWSFKAIATNKDGLRKQLGGAYAITPIPPASPWLSSGHVPPQPGFSTDGSGKGLKLIFEPASATRWRLVQLRRTANGDWFNLRLLPGDIKTHTLPDHPAVVAVRNVGFDGLLSAPTVIAK